MSDEATAEAMGGSPELGPGIREPEKAVKKRRKAAEKIRLDAQRPPRSFERFRILMEVVDEGRKVAELADHKARYALVVMGVLNAGVFFLLSRAHILSGMPAGAQPWLIGFLVAYAGLTFVFVLYAVDSLRPRRLRDTGLLAAATSHPHGSRGLLYWENIVPVRLDAYRQAWATATMEQLNAEIINVGHHLALVIDAKYRALGRLYAGLTVLVILAALQLVVYSGFALIN